MEVMGAVPDVRFLASCSYCFLCDSLVKHIHGGIFHVRGRFEVDGVRRQRQAHKRAVRPDHIPILIC